MDISLIDRADPSSTYHNSVVLSGVPISDMVKYQWLQIFMMAHDPIARAQTGKRSLSPEKQEIIEKSVVYHLGVVKRAFENGEFSEDLVSKADETHFLFNMDDGKTIGMFGDGILKYADFVSVNEGMKMMVHILGG